MCAGLHPEAPKHIPQLSALQHLTHLAVSDVRPATSLNVFARLHSLRSLSVTRWPFPTGIQALGGLTQLTALKLANVRGLLRNSPLHVPSSVQSLELTSDSEAESTVLSMSCVALATTLRSLKVRYHPR